MNRIIFVMGILLLNKAFPYTVTNTAYVYYGTNTVAAKAPDVSYWKNGSLTGCIRDTLSNEDLLNVSLSLNGSSSMGSKTYWVWKPIRQDNESHTFKAEKGGYYKKTKSISLSSSTTTLDFLLCPKKRDIPNYTWKMVSFPVEPSENSILGSDTLTCGDDLGNTAQNNWRTYIWDESAEEDEYLSKYINPATITSGLGYWFKYYNPGTISLFTQGTPTPATYTIHLKGGWNMVGNPSVFRLDKNRLKVLVGTETFPLGSKTENVFWGYDEGYQSKDFLLPHYGYWIRAISPCNLVFPSTEWDDEKGKGISTSLFALNNGLIKLIAKSKDRSIERIFGTCESASDGFDLGLDLSEPPQAMDSSLSMCFINQGERYAKDIKNPSDDIIWDVSIEGRNIELYFEGIEGIDKEYQVFLVDRGNIVDLRKNPRYTLDFGRNLKISLLKEGLIIKENKITKTISYPNPSPGNLTFYIGLKTNKASLSVTIYNIIGQKVYEGALLPSAGKSWERFSKEEQAYIYESSYAGKGSHNLPLASGLYIYEIKSYALNSEAKAYGKLLIKK